MASASPRFDIDHFYTYGRGRVIASVFAQFNSVQHEVGRTQYAPIGINRARDRTAHSYTTAPDPTLAEVLENSFEQGSEDEDKVTVQKQIPREVKNRVMDNYKLACPAVRRFLNLEPELNRITTRKSPLTVRKVAIVTPYRPVRKQDWD